MKRPVRLHQIGKEVLPGLFFGYALVAERIWKGDLSVADVEKLGHLDALQVRARRLDAKEVFDTTRGRTFNFPVTGGTAKLSGRDHEFREPTPRRKQLEGSEDLSGELQGEPGNFSTDRSKSDAEARRDFWSIQGDLIYRHHITIWCTTLFLCRKR